MSSNSALLPRDGSCPACHSAMDWGMVMRSCFGRKAGLAKEQEEADKATRRQRRKANRKAAKEGHVLVSNTDDDDHTNSALSTTDDEDDCERARLLSPSIDFTKTPLAAKMSSLLLVSPPKRIRLADATDDHKVGSEMEGGRRQEKGSRIAKGSDGKRQDLRPVRGGRAWTSRME